MYGKISTGMVDDGGAAQDGDQHRHDDESIRAAESEPDDPHSGRCWGLMPSFRMSTRELRVPRPVI